MAAYRLREEIVYLASARDGLSDIELFGTWSGVRENLYIDSRSIHIGNAAFVEIAEQFRHPSHSCLSSLGSLLKRAPGTIQEGRSRVMLLYGDCSHRLRLF